MSRCVLLKLPVFPSVRNAGSPGQQAAAVIERIGGDRGAVQRVVDVAGEVVVGVFDAGDVTGEIIECRGALVERVDFLVDDKPLPDETVGETIDSTRRVRWLNDALTILSDRELRIVRERCLNEESSTLESLGNRLGISKERVRQIENRALEKLRRALEERYPVAALHASL